ncbi:hypothetical protein LP421_06900 [Rhizobium sp. RCAM05350]|nr:hypothetical protein LP421_06900 [Rhizobium sp. RCAM05350]
MREMVSDDQIIRCLDAVAATILGQVQRLISQGDDFAGDCPMVSANATPMLLPTRSNCPSNGTGTCASTISAWQAP